MIGTMSFNKRIEAPAVVEVYGVGEFVNDDRVDDFRSGEEQAPVEVEVFLTTAAAPAGFLAFDGNAVIGGAHFL